LLSGQPAKRLIRADKLSALLSIGLEGSVVRETEQAPAVGLALAREREQAQAEVAVAVQEPVVAVGQEQALVARLAVARVRARAADSAQGQAADPALAREWPENSGPAVERALLRLELVPGHSLA